MQTKYTILKALIQNSNKNPGFTLLELIVGLSIMLLVGGFAMNAFVDSSKTFNNDKKNIDSSQNLSAILELVGNDIKQSGEQINDFNFPVISIEPNSDAGAMAGSSKITIRRALTSPLTLCEPITATSTVASNTLVVADNSQTASNASCAVGTTTATTTPSSIVRPTVLREARNYRCKLDDPNRDYSSTTTDFCDGSADEKVRAVMSDSSGNIRTFTYVSDDEVTANAKYNIGISASNISANIPATTTSITYNTIYLIEERIYALDSQGNLKLSIDGGSAQTLLSKIKKFNISARVYGDKTTKSPDIIDPTSVVAGTTNVLPFARRCNATASYYICEFKSAAYPTDDWKTIQGVKVELQSMYDATGRAAEANALQKDLDKLSAVAEFFPRNVLSR
jgi:prepilin-type N-terminal cleavage/methylation domain-containing protein